jgi:hypothetical protein
MTGEYKTVVNRLKCHLNQVITQRDSVTQDGQVVATEIIMSTPDTPIVSLDDLELMDTGDFDVCD